MKSIWTALVIFSFAPAWAAELCRSSSSSPGEILKFGKILKANVQSSDADDEATNVQLKDEKFAFEVCYAPVGGADARLAITKKLDSLRQDRTWDKEELIEALQEHHKSVKCTSQQLRRVDFAKPPSLDFPTPEPSCIYENIPELSLMKFKGYEVKAVPNATVKNKFADYSVEGLYEVKEDNGTIRYFATQTYSMRYMQKQNLERLETLKRLEAELKKQGKDPREARKILDARSHSHRYAIGTISEMEKLPDGSFTHKTDNKAKAGDGSFVCQFPYFPAGS